MQVVRTNWALGSRYGLSVVQTVEAVRNVVQPRQGGLCDRVVGVGDGELGIHELIGQEFEALKCGDETIGDAGEGGTLDSAWSPTVVGDGWTKRFEQLCRKIGLEGQIVKIYSPTTSRFGGGDKKVSKYRWRIPVTIGGARA